MVSLSGLTQEQQLKQLRAEAVWLKQNPHFEERPATIEEFFGPNYLDIEGTIRPGLRKLLIDIFGSKVGTNRMSKYERAMFTGAIGVGKTTFAAIALPYMAHWVLCLKDPQKYFGLMPGSRIAFMQMSTSEKQVLEVVFGDIFARIDNSVWFKRYPRDPKLTRLIKFPTKSVWIIPGDSTETSFEGYNILGGILDEMDSHKVTQERDYAELGYDTIESRIASRFIDPSTNTYKGLLICIGQMKKSSGFAARKYKEMLTDPHAHVTRMTIWESLGWNKFLRPDGHRDSFWYDPRRKNIVPSNIVRDLQTTGHLIEIPNAYRHQFQNNPQKALRDLAGIPPTVEDAFISREDKVLAASERWSENHGGSPSPVTQESFRSKFEDWFTANGHPVKRVMHIDIGTSGNGDACGIAMGHVKEMVILDGERKPYIVIDFLMRIKAPSGGQVMISDLRSLIYYVRDDLGFRLKVVTLDGFQSTDTFQQLRKRHFQADYLSIDKSTLPYEDLRDAIYEDRIEWPPYLTYLNMGDLLPVAIQNQEILQLQDNGKKIDHPPKGSKDVSDAIAGVVTTLMGDRTYHKGVVSRGVVNGAGLPLPDPFDPVVIGRNKINERQDALAKLNEPPSMGIFDAIASPFEIQVPARLRRRN